MAAAVGPQIRECTVAGAMEAGAYFVTSSIRSDTTPEDFDALLQDDRAQGYQLNHGGRLAWTALEVAIDKENVPLVRHILQLAQAAGLDVANLGGSDGHMPLLKAFYCPAAVRDEMEALLLGAGADVNTCSRRSGLQPGGITPLWFATSYGLQGLMRQFLAAGAVENPRRDQFEHNRAQCYCSLGNEAMVKKHTERIGWDKKFPNTTVWTSQMLEVVNKVNRVFPHSLKLSAAIGIARAETRGIDLFEEWEREGITLPVELNPYLDMGEKLGKA